MRSLKLQQITVACRSPWTMQHGFAYICNIAVPGQKVLEDSDISSATADDQIAGHDCNTVLGHEP